MARRHFLFLPALLLLAGCTARDPECVVEPLANPIFHVEGLAPGESVEFTARLVSRMIMDQEGLDEELVFDVDGQSRTLNWTLPRKLSIDLREGQEVEVLIRKTMGFGGSATGLRIRDKDGIVLLADDGVYGNALRPTEIEPFSYSQQDAGCRNRANRPGELNNFLLAVEEGNAKLELIHGNQGALQVGGRTYSVLVVKSTARVNDVQWTDAPYSHQAFVIARNQGSSRARGRPGQSPLPGWELAWADEFDGSTIDQSNTLNLGVGGWFDRPHMPPNDMTPQHLLVDYVRVYRRTGQEGP